MKFELELPLCRWLEALELIGKDQFEERGIGENCLLSASLIRQFMNGSKLSELIANLFSERE